MVTHPYPNPPLEGEGILSLLNPPLKGREFLAASTFRGREFSASSTFKGEVGRGMG